VLSDSTKYKYDDSVGTPCMMDSSSLGARRRLGQMYVLFTLLHRQSCVYMCVCIDRTLPSMRIARALSIAGTMVVNMRHLAGVVPGPQ